MLYLLGGWAGGLLLLLASAEAELQLWSQEPHDVVGDIQVPLNRKGSALAAAAKTLKKDLWPVGEVINYAIDTRHTYSRDPSDKALRSDDSRIRIAIAHWEAKTCFRFRKCSSVDTCGRPFIRFLSAKSICNSPLGLSSSQVNQINIGDTCTTGSVVHEIGHSLGLAHEQSRNDRDNYVYVDEEAIETKRLHNFDKTGKAGRDIGPYDYGSIMHYSEYASSDEDAGRPTILSPELIGQRGSLSERDVAAIEFMYNGCSRVYARPKCMASVVADKLHRIPFGSMWIVEFNVVHPTSEVSYDVSHGMPYKVTRKTGTVIKDAGKVRVGVTPTEDMAGQEHFVGATFKATDSTAEVTCSVRVQVAASNVTCFGLAGDDPAVCGARGVCTGSFPEPCSCNKQYGGLDCRGYKTCIRNRFTDFEEGTEGWKRRGNARIDRDFTAIGFGAVQVGNGTDDGMSMVYLPLEREEQPRRVTMHVARGAGETLLIGLLNTTRKTCAWVSIDEQGIWKLQKTRLPLVPREAGRYFHVDMRVDWVGREVSLLVDGQHLGSASLRDECMGAKFVAVRGNGWVDEVAVLCTDYIIPDIPSAPFTPEQIRAGGGRLVFRTVGERTEWRDTDANKDRLRAALTGSTAFGNNTEWAERVQRMVQPPCDVRFSGGVATVGPLNPDPEWRGETAQVVMLDLPQELFTNEYVDGHLDHGGAVVLHVRGTCDGGSFYEAFDTAEGGYLQLHSTQDEYYTSGQGKQASFVSLAVTVDDATAGVLVTISFGEGKTLQLVVGDERERLVSRNGRASVDHGPVTTGQRQEVAALFDWEAGTALLVVNGRNSDETTLPAGAEGVYSFRVERGRADARIDDVYLSCSAYGYLTQSPPTMPPNTLVPTQTPPTAAPPTVSPPTEAPGTLVPTQAPPTVAPPTAAPPTMPPITLVPTQAPPTLAPTAAPPTMPPITLIPTQAPPTLVPPTAAPRTMPPNTITPSKAPPTESPRTGVPTTLSPGGRPLVRVMVLLRVRVTDVRSAWEAVERQVTQSLRRLGGTAEVTAMCTERTQCYYAKTTGVADRSEMQWSFMVDVEASRGASTDVVDAIQDSAPLIASSLGAPPTTTVLVRERSAGTPDPPGTTPAPSDSSKGLSGGIIALIVVLCLLAAAAACAAVYFFFIRTPTTPQGSEPVNMKPLPHDDARVV